MSDSNTTPQNGAPLNFVPNQAAPGSLGTKEAAWTDVIIDAGSVSELIEELKKDIEDLKLAVDTRPDGLNIEWAAAEMRKVEELWAQVSAAADSVVDKNAEITTLQLEIDGLYFSIDALFGMGWDENGDPLPGFVEMKDKLNEASMMKASLDLQTASQASMNADLDQHRTDISRLNDEIQTAKEMRDDKEKELEEKEFGAEAIYADGESEDHHDPITPGIPSLEDLRTAKDDAHDFLYEEGHPISGDYNWIVPLKSGGERIFSNYIPSNNKVAAFKNSPKTKFSDAAFRFLKSSVSYYTSVVGHIAALEKTDAKWDTEVDPGTGALLRDTTPEIGAMAEFLTLLNNVDSVEGLLIPSYIQTEPSMSFMQDSGYLDEYGVRYPEISELEYNKQIDRNSQYTLSPDLRPYVVEFYDYVYSLRKFGTHASDIGIDLGEFPAYPGRHRPPQVSDDEKNGSQSAIYELMYGYNAEGEDGVEAWDLVDYPYILGHPGPTDSVRYAGWDSVISDIRNDLHKAGPSEVFSDQVNYDMHEAESSSTRFSVYLAGTELAGLEAEFNALLAEYIILVDEHDAAHEAYTTRAAEVAGLYTDIELSNQARSAKEQEKASKEAKIIDLEYALKESLDRLAVDSKELTERLQGRTLDELIAEVASLQTEYENIPATMLQIKEKQDELKALGVEAQSLGGEKAIRHQGFNVVYMAFMNTLIEAGGLDPADFEGLQAMDIQIDTVKIDTNGHKDPYYDKA